MFFIFSSTERKRKKLREKEKTKGERKEVLKCSEVFCKTTGSRHNFLSCFFSPSLSYSFFVLFANKILLDGKWFKVEAGEREERSKTRSLTLRWDGRDHENEMDEKCLEWHETFHKNSLEVTPSSSFPPFYFFFFLPFCHHHNNAVPAYDGVKQVRENVKNFGTTQRERVGGRESKRLVQSWGTRCWKWSQMKQGRQMSTFFLIFFLLHFLLLLPSLRIYFSFLLKFCSQDEEGRKENILRESVTQGEEKELWEEMRMNPRRTFQLILLGTWFCASTIA